MWRDLAIETFISPRAAARRVIALDLPPRTLVEAGLAVIAIAMVMGFAAVWVAGGAPDPVTAAVLASPLLGAAAQVVVMTAAALLTWRVGRMLGGRGGFWAAVAVVVWLNAATLLIQAAQLVALVVAPPLAGLISIATLVWLLWAYANFAAELHGFDSPIIVLGVTVMTVIVLVFAATLFAALLGIGTGGAS